ncbi:hypothetical protein RA210_U10560 [Rubrivivax sp. A210]|nr:hypothetical protein RA210_U10560 [Rubrivivax sp. A210]
MTFRKRRYSRQRTESSSLPAFKADLCRYRQVARALGDAQAQPCDARRCRAPRLNTEQ